MLGTMKHPWDYNNHPDYARLMAEAKAKSPNVPEYELSQAIHFNLHRERTYIPLEPCDSADEVYSGTATYEAGY